MEIGDVTYNDMLCNVELKTLTAIVLVHLAYLKFRFSN